MSHPRSMRRLIAERLMPICNSCPWAITPCWPRARSRTALSMACALRLARLAGSTAPSSPTRPGSRRETDPWVTSATTQRNKRYDSAAVAFPDDAQALQREQVVDLVHLLAERDDRPRQAAGGEGRGLLAQLFADAPDDRVHLAGEAVDHTRLQRRLRVLADHRGGRVEVDLEQPRGAACQRVDGDLHPRGQHAAQVLARRGDDVVVG